MNADVCAAESAITLAMVDGTLRNARLYAALRAVDDGRLRMPLTSLRQALATSDAATVDDGLTMVLSGLRVRQGIPIADLQILAIGFYRLLWHLLVRLDADISLNELRRLSPAQAAQICYGFTFGCQPSPFPLPVTICGRMYDRVHHFRHAEGADQTWRVPRPLPVEVPVVAVNDPHLNPSLNAIRNAFLTEVFTTALIAETPTGPDALICELLFVADANPRAFAFLRDNTPAQARFRLRQVALALIALHHQASTEGRVASGIVAREFIIACLLSPVVSLRGWLLAKRDRLIIPLVYETTAGNPLVVSPEPTIGESAMLGQSPQARGKCIGMSARA